MSEISPKILQTAEKAFTSAVEQVRCSVCYAECGDRCDGGLTHEMRIVESIAASMQELLTQSATPAPTKKDFKSQPNPTVFVQR